MKNRPYSLRSTIFLGIVVGLSILFLFQFSKSYSDDSLIEQSENNDNYEDYENFQYEQLVLNASTIQTAIGTIQFDNPYHIQVGIDSYHFNDDLENDLIVQMNMGPALTSETDRKLIVQVSGETFQRVDKEKIDIHFCMNISFLRNGLEIYNKSYFMGVDNYNGPEAELAYNKLAFVLKNESNWASANYSVIFQPWIMVEIQLDSTEFHFEVQEENFRSYLLSRTSGNFSMIHVRNVIREVNPVLETIVKIMNFEYFDLVFFGIIILVSLLFRPTQTNHGIMSDGNIFHRTTNKATSFIQIACISDINPVDNLQQTIKPYFLFMLLPIPLVFISKYIPILGYVGFIVFLNFIPLIGLIRYQYKYGTLMPFKQFLKWHLISDIFLIFGVFFLILSVALIVLGYILDSAQILLYLLTFIYIFNFVRERRREFENNTGIKKYLVIPLLLVIVIVLFIRYVLPLFLFIIVQSYPPGEYLDFYQYQIAGLVLGLEKIRWDFNIGGILFFVYILNEYQVDLIKIYDPRNSKKFIIKFIFIFYIILYMIATIIFPNLMNMTMFSGFIEPHLIMMQKETIPYEIIEYLYPDAVASHLLTFSSTNPSLFAFGSLSIVNLTNIFVLIGIVLSTPRLYYYIFTNPEQIDLFTFEYLFRMKFKHFTLVSTLIMFFMGYVLLVTAMEVVVLVLICYCGFILRRCHQASSEMNSNIGEFKSSNQIITQNQIRGTQTMDLNQTTRSNTIQVLQKGLFCTQCGYRNKAGALFCNQCGKKI